MFEKLEQFIEWCHARKEQIYCAVETYLELTKRASNPIWETNMPVDSSIQPYTVNYNNRKHIFAYNPGATPIILVDNAGEYTAQLTPLTWTNISFPNGTKLKAQAANQVFRVLCTDDMYHQGFPLNTAGQVPALITNTNAFGTTGLGTFSIARTAFSNNGTAANFTSPDIFVGDLRELGIDIVFGSFVGGAAPTITYTVKRKDAFGNYLTIYTSAALSAATNIALSLGAGMGSGTLTGIDAGEGEAFGFTIQVGYTTTGAPTSVVQSISVIGK
jgi:hypothetical protein